MPSKDPIIALVIVTRNRREQLLRTLQSLKKLRTHLTWELILVDNGSTDGTARVIEGFAAEFTQPLRLVYEPAVGQGNARNAGWTSTKAEIIAYLDDDCYPAENFLDAVVECFAETPNLGFMSGRILLYDQTDLRMTIQESVTRVHLPLQLHPSRGYTGSKFRVPTCFPRRGRRFRSALWWRERPVSC